MLRVSIHSRRGNAVLGFLGVLYAVAAATLLVWHLAQTWGAAGTIDRLIQAVLIGTFLTGVWFARIAMENLGGVARGPSSEGRRHSKPATV